MDWFNAIIDKHMVEYLDIDCIVDYKTFLQEQVQKYGVDLPIYECYKMTGPEHKKLFHYKVNIQIKGLEFESFGKAYDKKSAQQIAAKECVQLLKKKKLI